jgi:hypothetical protein
VRRARCVTRKQSLALRTVFASTCAAAAAAGPCTTRTTRCALVMVLAPSSRCAPHGVPPCSGSRLFSGPPASTPHRQSRGDRTLDAFALRGSLARLRGDIESIYGALLLGSWRSRRYLRDASRARFQVVDGVRAHLANSTKPGAVLLRLAFSVPVVFLAAAVPFFDTRRARPGAVLGYASRLQTGPAGAPSTLPHGRTTQPPTSATM